MGPWSSPSVLWVAGVLLVALVVRTASVGRFAVVDEAKFAKRSTAFYNAIWRGDLPATFQSSHPAVITLWIGAIASGVQSFERYGRACPAVTIRPLEEPEACALDERTLIAGLHLGNALVTWALLAACAVCLVRLYGVAQGTLLLGLVIVDPFLTAHARIAHHEGILAHGLLASGLTLALYARERRPGLLVASAALAGLATAEKLPGLFAFLVAAALLLHGAPREARGWARARWWAARMAIWSVVTLGTVFVVWPALWSAPLRTVHSVVAEIGGMLEEAPAGQHLLLGEVRAAEANLLLYALTLLFRLTPLSLAGLVVGLVLAIWDRSARREIAPWLGYAAAFVGVMSFGTKQGGRYILSAFPAIDIVAGLAWWRIAQALSRRAGWSGGRGLAALVFAPVVLGLAYILPAAPYYLSSYNWLAGGPRVAARTIDMGLGEGLDRAAAYLNALPGAEAMVAASGYREAFAPFFVGESESLEYDTVYSADYSVFYINQWQKRPDWLLWRTYQDRTPEHVVMLQGIPYARIYANPIPEAALAYLAEQATSRDLVVAEISSLLTRNYRGAAPLWLPSGSAEELRADLEARLADADAVWWVVYPRSRGDDVEALSAVLGARTEPASARDFSDLTIERRPVRPTR